MPAVILFWLPRHDADSKICGSMGTDKSVLPQEVYGTAAESQQMCLPG